MPPSKGLLHRCSESWRWQGYHRRGWQRLETDQMKRSTHRVIGISFFIIAICAALLVLIYSLQVPADFRQLRNGMTQEEVNGLLGQPYLTVRREDESNTLRLVPPVDTSGNR